MLKKTSDVVLEDVNIEGVLLARYTGKTKSLLNYIDMCEKNGNANCVIIHHHDYPQLKSDFLGLFTIVEASGGLIVNENQDFLFIFRRGFWDLPKGKMEKGESKKQTAKREVVEETGIDSVKIISKLGITNHTYKNRSGKRMIKKSHWYLMSGSDQKLKPQLEEDITMAKWIDIEELNNKYSPVFLNILDVVSFYKEQILVH